MLSLDGFLLRSAALGYERLRRLTASHAFLNGNLQRLVGECIFPFTTQKMTRAFRDALPAERGSNSTRRTSRFAFACDAKSLGLEPSIPSLERGHNEGLQHGSGTLLRRYGANR